MESVSDVLFDFIPFYHLWKAAFLVWLFLDSTRGAEQVYKVVLEPLLVKHESKIDAAADRISAGMKRVVKDVAANEDLRQAAKDVSGEAISRMAAANMHTD